jgi:hypothetical protein
LPEAEYRAKGHGFFIVQKKEYDQLLLARINITSVLVPFKTVNLSVDSTCAHAPNGKRESAIKRGYRYRFLIFISASGCK